MTKELPQNNEAPIQKHPNVVALEAFLANSDLVHEYAGHYVVIQHGQLLAPAEDITELIQFNLQHPKSEHFLYRFVKPSNGNSGITK